ncbi:MAG: hypothetical protein QM658_10805 [Gordonia sp. (in: high G+C Gram-positive bacteria)]
MSDRASRMLLAGAIGLGCLSVVLGAGPASADAPGAPSSTQQVDRPQNQKPDAFGDDLAADDVTGPSIPMPAPAGAYSYLATRSATLWLHSVDAPERIAALPASPDYAKANRQLAEHFDRELTSAVKTPGACVQIIIDPTVGGGKFSYGVWAVESKYCPK